MKLTTPTIVITCISALLLIGGCSVTNPFTAADSMSAAPTVPGMSITYTTSSDRLNVLAGAAPTNQFASTDQPSQSALPNLTESTLEIQHPHPSGRQDLARVVLTVHLEGNSTDGATVETKTLDIPAWQVTAVHEKLDQASFFRRSRTLGAEVDLSVTDDRGEFAKRFRSIPELDALLLRVAREGRPLHLATARAQPGSFHRVPPIN